MSTIRETVRTTLNEEGFGSYSDQTVVDVAIVNLEIREERSSPSSVTAWPAWASPTRRSTRSSPTSVWRSPRPSRSPSRST